MIPKEVREAATLVTKKLSDQGLVLEGGYAAFIIVNGLEQAPLEQKRQLKEAYYAGAQHLFGSLMAIMDEDKEPTPQDLRRMDLIHQELERWLQSHKKQN